MNSMEPTEGNVNQASDTSMPPLTAPQRQRLAEMVARGDGLIPKDIAPADRELLAAEVRTILRSRLLRLIARAIARDIHSQQTHGGAHD